MITITLTGQMPSGKNAVNVTRSGRHYPNERFVSWREKAAWETKIQLRGQERFSPEAFVLMECWYYPGDLRRRDVPGIEDALLHLFGKGQMELVKDDSQIRDQNFHRMKIDRKNPRIKIELSEIDDADEL